MSNNKSLADRILAIQEHCLDTHTILEITLDIESKAWIAWDETISEELVGPTESFEDLIEALEAHFEL